MDGKSLKLEMTDAAPGDSGNSCRSTGTSGLDGLEANLSGGVHGASMAFKRWLILISEATAFCAMIIALTNRTTAGGASNLIW